MVLFSPAFVLSMRTYSCLGRCIMLEFMQLSYNSRLCLNRACLKIYLCLIPDVPCSLG